MINPDPIIIGLFILLGLSVITNAVLAYFIYKQATDTRIESLSLAEKSLLCFKANSAAEATDAVSTLDYNKKNLELQEEMIKNPTENNVVPKGFRDAHGNEYEVLR